VSGLAGVAPGVDVGSSQCRGGGPTCTPGAGSTPAAPAGASGGGWQNGSSTYITHAQFEHNIAAHKSQLAVINIEVTICKSKPAQKH